MARKLKSDPVLFVATVGLVCLSIVMVWSASAVVAMERYQQPYLFLIKQVMWSLLGLAVLWATHLIDEIRPSDDLIILHQGRVVASGAVDQVVARTRASSLDAAFTTLTSASGAQAE